VPDVPALRFVTDEQLSKKRRIVNGGYLLCEDVPIARVGTLVYAPGEVPVAPGPDGLVRIDRDPDDVFDERSIRTFEGMPIVDEHPMIGDEVIGVDPDNWKTHSLGTVFNVRRGTGPEGSEDNDPDIMYGDFLFQDRRGIRLVDSGKRQVSAGYDADYESLGPGRGRQHNIIGNHVALVERGRCGPRCSIGDAAARSKENKGMPKKMTLRDHVAAVRDAIGAARKRVRAGDAEGGVEELDRIPEMLGEVISGDAFPEEAGGMGAKDGHTHVTVNIHGKRPGVDGEPGAGVDEAPDGAMPGAKRPMPGAGEGSEGDDTPPWAQALVQRIENMEEVVVALSEKMGGGEPDGDEDEGAEDDGGAMGDAEPDMEDKVPGERADTTHASMDKRRGGDKRRAGDRAQPGRARVGDSTSLAAAFSDMLARAEVLAPGMNVPTYDSTRGARDTSAAMCSFRRNTLRRAYTGDAKAAIDSMLAGSKPMFHDSAAMACPEVNAVFNGASTLLRAQRTGDFESSFTGDTTAKVVMNGSGVSLSPAALAKRFADNKDKWYPPFNGHR
jgi:hypothetical protein